MNTEVTTSQSFQEKMFERIRAQMGDLMTDEDLRNIVNAAMQRAFFDQRVSKDRNGYNNVVQEPLFVEMVRGLLKEQVYSAMSAWLAEHKDEVLKAVDETIAKGFFDLVKQHLETKINQPLWSFQEALRQKGILG